MAYTYGKSKFKETYDYWELWNKKNKNVENYFLKQWEDQFSRIRKICQNIETTGEYIKENNFDHDEPYYSEFVGSVFSITPSGKYYMPFASSNVSVKEAAIDEFWNEEFQKILEEEGCWDEGGEGDPCDMFICKIAEKRKPEISNEDFDRILSEIINEDLTAKDILAIPGIYEILSEYYNNDIIGRYESEDI